jgi:hypothetical protein
MPENLPDHLAPFGQRVFESNGLCFAVTLREHERICWLSLFFQNRYARPCRGDVALVPPLRSFRLGRHVTPPVKMPIQCAGGAFGVVHLPYPVAAIVAGRRITFDVSAAIQYPNRRGKELRFTSGIPVPAIPRPGIDLDHLVLTHLIPLAGLIELICNTFAGHRVTLKLPDRALAPAGAAPQAEILWRPAVPTATESTLKAAT